MINPTISADWSTIKPIPAFSSTHGIQEVHTPGLLRLGVLFNCHA